MATFTYQKKVIEFLPKSIFFDVVIVAKVVAGIALTALKKRKVTEIRINSSAWFLWILC